MKNYKVKVTLSKVAVVEVAAANETEALEKARREARYQNYGCQDQGAEVVFTAEYGRPAMPIPTEWQIYSTMAGAAAANKAITAAVTKVAENLAQLADSDDLSKSRIKGQVESYIKPLFKRYEKFGTYDSEPGAQVASFLAKWVFKLDSSFDQDAIADLVDGSLS